MKAPPPPKLAHPLFVDLENNELHFRISKFSPSSMETSCTISLRHPGTTDKCLAYKIKTTQPQRYLVKPNQGLIGPDQSETITITLVDEEKLLLLQSFDRLGPSSLDPLPKDKFLIQSCEVSTKISNRYLAKVKKMGSTMEANKDMIEAVTTMWNSVTSDNTKSNNIPLFNLKLRVRHSVTDDEGAFASSTAAAGGDGGFGTFHDASHQQSLATAATGTDRNTSHDHILSELSELRRKYEELVIVTENLTTERDILSNTLQQAKIDLRREIKLRKAMEKGNIRTGTNNFPHQQHQQSSGGLLFWFRRQQRYHKS